MKTNKFFFISFILFLFSWVIYLFKPFLLTITIGVLMAVSTASFHSKVLKFARNNQIVASALTTIFLGALFLVPLLYAIIVLAQNIAHFDMSYISKTADYIKNLNPQLPSFLSFLEPKIHGFLASIDLGGVAKSAFSYTSKFLAGGSNFITDFGLIIIFYFFANLYGNNLLKLIKDNIPIEKEHLEYIFSQVTSTMSVVFYSTILNAVLQGALFGIIAMFFGFNGLFFGILFAFASLIPVVGGALIYVPMCVYELAIGEKIAALIVLIYSVVIISTLADNFVKPLIIKFINTKLGFTKTNLNEMLIFFAMMAGISTFGFWGMILGPAIVTMFVATLSSYDTLKKKFGFI